MLYSRHQRARRALPDGGDYPEAHARAPHSGIRGSWGQCGARGAHFCDLNLPFLPRVVCCTRFSVLVCISNVRALDWAIVRVDVDCSEDVLPPLGLSVQRARAHRPNSRWWWWCAGESGKLHDASKVELIRINDDLMCVLYFIMC
ncbi:hypothetical protein ISCGN_013166 [Ixodes scapularis]